LRVLVLDDDRISRETTTQQLQDAGYPADRAENAYQALQRLETENWDVVLTDLRMPHMDGIEFLRQVRRRFPNVDVILMTAYGTIETAVSAMQEGAEDFLTKPFSFKELELRLKKLSRRRETQRQLQALQSKLDEFSHSWGIVGRSAGMQRVFDLIRLFADSPAPVLITGETGTGKELIGRALHESNTRRQGPFVAVACGAIPREVAESEIFGHEKGAFTGAIQRRRGSFERANRGTLLLDDVDDLPLDLQAKLVRVLQEEVIQRVGGEEDIRVDVRVIATTKVNLEEAVTAGNFRMDMFYRLRGLEIKLPPLRERGEDILLLSHHFLRILARNEEEAPKTLSLETANCLQRHRWPGNVRELRRVLGVAAALCNESEITLRHLPHYLQEKPRDAKPFTLQIAETGKIDFSGLVQQFEEELFNWALKASGGEQQRAAELLGLPRTTLQSKLSRRKAR
jgi:DNA-binding NtrC family response regulator